MTLPTRYLFAMAAALWIGMAQAQVEGVDAPVEPMELRFSEFFRTPIGPLGVEMSDTLRQAHGRTVRLVGYMVQQEIPLPGRFMLTPRPVQMSEHADGEADDLPAATVMVYLDPSQKDWTLAHVRGLVAVTGSLSVSRFEESDGRVSWMRLRLGPQAVRGMNAFEVASYLHGLQHRH